MTERIRIINLGRKTFLAAFWDEKTGTEALQFWSLDVSSQYPTEERLWHSDKPLSDEKLEAIGATWNYRDGFGITDANRRAVPTREMVREVLADMSVQMIDEVEQLRAPSDSDAQLILEMVDCGFMPWPSEDFGNRRDLLARVKALDAATTYISSRVFYKDTSPIRRVQEELGLSTYGEARNVIERARRYGYLTRESDGVGLGSNAQTDVGTLWRLIHRAREAKASNS